MRGLAKPFSIPSPRPPTPHPSSPPSFSHSAATWPTASVVRALIRHRIRVCACIHPRRPPLSHLEVVFVRVNGLVYLRILCRTSVFLPLAPLGSPRRTRGHENRIFICSPPRPPSSVSISKNDNIEFFGSSYGSGGDR